MTTELNQIISILTAMTDEGLIMWNPTIREHLEQNGLPTDARQHKSVWFNGGALHLLDFDMSTVDQKYSRSILAYRKNNKLKIIYDAESMEIKELLKAAKFQSPLVWKLERLLTNFPAKFA